ncbi:MAG: S8 family serine peptidase [Ardenticatenaceae bacterium]|nr:S8 family serine peptidase [Anaerolineales bacterium]MCB8917031.1 S8 family serine peptidase [Ardenticatenaceae bacterium]
MSRRSQFFLFLMAGLGLLTILLLSGDLQAVRADLAVAPAAPDDYVYGQWQIAPNSDFAFTRFDAEYSATTGKVYVLGGRLADGNTDGSVWEFDPATGTYTDTGVDMPVPISNYQIASVDNAGTEVLMIFGGRPAAGGVTNAVQGYVPATNTTIDLTATDPLPISTSPGGVVTVDNIVYIFGGFDAAVVTDQTFFFDISAAPGSRYTVGPNLTQARSYIAATAVDGYVYAIGGDDFDGAALLPLNIAERLDTSNPTAWDDAGVADMPIACDETPAFGFDSDSAYDLAGAIIIAGCGQWSDEIDEVQLYDVASNSWDMDFPNLNEARRNHAGAFVPTGDGTGGTPGMWLWGGRQASDATVLTIPEYYQVTPLGDFTLVPQEQFVSGFGTVTVNMGAANNSGAADTFSLSYSGTQTWPISGPASVAVADGDLVAFTFDVEIPVNATCLDVDVVTIDAVGQVNTSLMDSATATVEFFCPTGVAGTIYDGNSSLALPDAYVYIENVADGSIYGEGFANENGEYLITDVPAGDYYLAVSAEGYQWSVLPDGWPTGADQITIAAAVLTQHDVSLNAPIMEWSANSYDVTLNAGEQMAYTLTITNSGTSPLYLSIGNYDEGVQPPPEQPSPAGPNYRVDPRILSDLAANGSADFIVVMAEQADLSGAYAIRDWNARGQYVWDRLAATAERTQAGLRGQLAAAGLSYRPFVASNGLLVYGGSAELVNQIAARLDVAYLMANDSVALVKPPAGPSPQSPTTLTWGVMAVNADDVWAGGVTGQGMVVANVDSGVEWTHPALQAQYRGGVGDHDYNWYMPTSGCPGETEPCDNDGHGTHTMGTMVGSTDPGDPANATEGIGVAPGAEWIACKGCEANGCSFEALLACGDWILAPTDLDGMNPDPSKRPNVVNNSWGGGGGDFWYGGVVGAWRAAGIFPQFSAGNNGPNCSTTGSPGDYGLSFGAAAIAENLSIAGFSSRGPAAVTGMLKPNVSAPGVAVRSSLPGDTYGNLGGTSMASPHVAGTVALIWSAQPALVGQIEDTMWLLSQTATPLYTLDGCGGDTGSSHPNHTFGWGLVNADAAVANAAGIVISWLDVNPAGAIIPAGQSAEITLLFTAPTEAGTYMGTLLLNADEPYNPEVTIPLTLNVEGYLITLPFIAKP